MSRPADPPARASLEELFRLLPSLEEAEELRLALAGAAEPVPGGEWSRAGSYATVDRWVVGIDGVEAALRTAERLHHRQVRNFYRGYARALRRQMAGDVSGAVEELLALAEAAELTGRLERARALYEVALSLSLPLPGKELQALGLRRIARILRGQAELAEALLYYERSAEVGELADDATAVVGARIGIGTVLVYQGRWAEAERSFLQALELLDARAAGPALERGQIHNNLGMVLTREGRLEEAEAWFERALALWGEMDSPVDLAICRHNLAILRKRQGRRAEALTHYLEALALAVPAALRAVIATDLARFHLEEGDFAEATRWGREAERQAVAGRSPYALGHMYLGLGNIARGRGDEEGFVFYEKALEIAREKRLPFLEAETLLDYALLRRRMGGAEEARSYAERAREIFQQLEAVHEQERAARILAEVTTPEVEVDPV
jgi:tetratricopeptide (TPR) repeat protein